MFGKKLQPRTLIITFSIAAVVFAGLFIAVAISEGLDLSFKSSPLPGLLAVILMSAVLYFKYAHSIHKNLPPDALVFKIRKVLGTAVLAILITGFIYYFIRK